MRIGKFPTTTGRQFGSIPVICTDLMMTDVICMINPNVQAYAIHRTFEETRKGIINGFVYMFKSGAKLGTSGLKDFYIYSYSHDGKDGEAAADELRMGRALREAKRHFTNMYTKTSAPCNTSDIPEFTFALKYKGS